MRPPAAVPASAVVITATSVDNTSVSARTPAITIKSGIIVALTTAPPSSLAPAGPATIADTVTGDSANAGVNWSCCPSPTCGSFNPTKTASTATTVYTAGTTTSNIIIKATSVTDSTQSASATTTITTAAGGTLAPGNDVFCLSGMDINTASYSVAGVFTVSNTGTITGGEQDFADFSYEVHDSISSGTVALSSTSGDRNLTITLETGDPCIGPGSDGTCNTGTGSGQEVLDVTLI